MGKHRHSVAQVLDQHWCCIVYFIHLFPLYFTQTKRFFLFLSRKGLQRQFFIFQFCVHISPLSSSRLSVLLLSVSLSSAFCWWSHMFAYTPPSDTNSSCLSLIKEERRKNTINVSSIAHITTKKKREKTNKKNAGLYLPLSIISPSRTTRIWSAFTIVDNLKEIKAVKLFSTKGVSF